jgi:hypothetical protein
MNGILNGLAAILRPHHRYDGRHRIENQPPHPGYDNGPGPLDELAWPLDAHAARAELVQLCAQLRDDADTHAAHGNTDLAVGINHTRQHLEAILRRWDIRVDAA